MADEEGSPQFSVNCRTCLVEVWSGNIAPENGQSLLNKFGDERCPRVNCPHKLANRSADPDDNQPVTKKDLRSLTARLAAVEGKVNDRPIVSR